MTAERTLAGLFERISGSAPAEVTPLTSAGSPRRYFRLSGTYRAGKPCTVIGTEGTDRDENRAFLTLSDHFASAGVNVPHILAVSDDGMCYLQTDLGDISLFSALAADRENQNFSPDSRMMLRSAMKLLAEVQFKGGRNAPWHVCFPQEAMDSRMVRWDLNYFKYSFLKGTVGSIDEVALENEFDRLHDRLMERALNAATFMVRDFQSRNIMWHGGEPWLIDFQGGRRGPAEYDVASFLWQARARYTPELRQELAESYIQAATAISSDFNPEAFLGALPYFVLFRMLQTLGAYGFRGMQQRKPQFLTPIPAALQNLSEHLHTTELDDEFPTLAALAENAAQSEAIREIYALGSVGPFNGLTVTVTSFSYKKGIPADLSGNGGGFVFDCRAIHNPGRYEPYKKLTGRDEEVRKFLEKDGEIFRFLDNAFSLTDAAVERYLKRGFTSLCISFGCTGGQHRSVYSAEATAHHIREKFPLTRVVLFHREQGITEIHQSRHDGSSSSATPQQ